VLSDMKSDAGLPKIYNNNNQLLYIMHLLDL